MVMHLSQIKTCQLWTMMDMLRSSWLILAIKISTLHWDVFSWLRRSLVKYIYSLQLRCLGFSGMNNYRFATEVYWKTVNGELVVQVVGSSTRHQELSIGDQVTIRCHGNYDVWIGWRVPCTLQILSRIMTDDVLQNVSSKRWRTKGLKQWRTLLLLMEEILHHLGCIEPWK